MQAMCTGAVTNVHQRALYEAKVSQIAKQARLNFVFDEKTVLEVLCTYRLKAQRSKCGVVK